jgi:hypothetical protein
MQATSPRRRGYDVRMTAPLRTLLLALVLVTACKEKPPVHYDAGGLRFKYPGSWSLEEGAPEKAGAGTVKQRSLEASGGLLSITEFQPSIDVDVETFAENVVKGLGAEISSKSFGAFTTGAATKKTIERKIAGALRAGVEHHFNLQVLGEKVPTTTRTWGVPLADRMVIVYRQCADEDAEKFDAGAAMVLDSLALSR